MIKKWIITGDTHANVDRFHNLEENPEETAIIILGDAGCNYYLNKRDDKLKKLMSDFGYIFYLVRGNHEQRPQLLESMLQSYDENVDGWIYFEEKYPNIRYLKDGEEYSINGLHTIVIGGAYSVDKFYRQSRGWTWFEQEQLNTEEMTKIEEKLKEKTFDLVLTHTCPFSWQPTDLFIGGVDQSTVDNSMEKWMEQLRNKFHWNVWLFGHFHADRLVRPHVEMYFNDMEDLSVIWDRWNSDEEPDIRWIPKDPNYYMGE
jgi:3-oxoacid CoA-transferase subunit A